MRSESARRHLTRSTAGLLAAAVLAGCGSPAATGSTSLGAQALRNLTPFEKKVLKDKTVSVAELMQATQVYTECLTAKQVGFEHGDPSDLGPSGIQTLITVAPTVPNPDAVAAALTAKAHACLDSVAAVEDVWLLQHQLSQSDLDKAKSVFVRCVRAAGVPLAAGATFDDAGTAARKLLKDATGELDPSTAKGSEVVAIGGCMSSITQSSQVALPGLQQALDALDTRAW